MILQIEAYLARRALDTAALVLADGTIEVEARKARDRLAAYCSHKQRMLQEAGGDASLCLLGVGEVVLQKEVPDGTRINLDGSYSRPL